MSEPLKSPFACVDSPVGDQVWRLEQPGLDPGLRGELEAHLSVCHACRLLVNVDAKVRELARAGRLEGAGSSLRSRLPRRSRSRATWVAGLALVASVAAIAILPPRPVADGSSVRGLDPIRFLRPVEGEVVAAGRPVLRWTPIAGASRYLVEIRDQDGGLLWKGESPKTSIRLPQALSLTHGREYKALLSTQPADLTPPGHPSVLFRSDSRWRRALHGLRWANPLLQAAAGLSLAMVLVLGIRRWR